MSKQETGPVEHAQDSASSFSNILISVFQMDIFQDKDAKISFLQKAIDVVVIVSGEPLSAKPTRIVAGHEPERTNELLQRIGKCCLSKVAPPAPELGAVHTREGDTPGRATRRATPGSGQHWSGL